MNQTLEMEVVKPDDKLVKFAAITGLEKQPTETLLDAFRPVYAKARTALTGAEGVAASVKDATCVTEIRKSRACRLEIRAVRIECEKIHKAQKESALRFGRAVDGFKSILLAEIVPVEEALQAAEDTAERAEAARKATLKAEREADLAPLLDGSTILVDLSTLTPDAWAKLLADHRLLKQAKIDAAAKLEADRLAREEEARRIAAENERLKQEAIEKEKALAAEREAATQKQAALEAAAKAEREAAEKKLADERAQAARIAAAEKARVDMQARLEREEAERKLAAERAEAARVATKIKAQADAEAKAAAEKAAKERAAVEAKAKAERDAIEEAARQERLKAQAAAEAQRQKLAAAEAEAKRLRDAEAAKVEAAAKAAKKAAAAPDKQKLMAYTAAIRSVPIPFVESVSDQIEIDRETFTARIEEKARAL